MNLVPNFVIFYVASPALSAAFYAKLLSLNPVEQSAGWAFFDLPNGLMLGLWSKTEVAPAATQVGGGMEIGFPVASDEELTSLFQDWRRQGLPVLQEPTTMDFGLTFVVADPDGHRIRVFHPA